MIHSHSTARNARSIGPTSGARQTASARRPSVGTATSAARPRRLLGEAETLQALHAATLTASAREVRRS